MHAETRRQMIVAAAAIVVFFTGLGTPYLWDEDEPKNAACAREMLEAGNWVVPQFNYQLRTDKPILLYWLMMASYAVFGVGEFAARFWSATLAVGTVLLTYQLGRRLYRPEVGLWAGLAMAGCLMFAASGRAATPDSTLIFCTTLTMFLFVRFGGVLQGVLSRGGYAAMYGAMSLAVLAKGPVGVVLPVGILGLFLLCRGQQRRTAGDRFEIGDGTLSAVQPVSRFSPPPWRRALTSIVQTLAPRRLVEAAWSLRPFTALLVLAVVALPWYVLVGLRTDGAWLEGFLGKHNVGRFTAPMEGHGGPVFYYIVAVLVGFFPWSCFLPLAVYRLVRRLAAPTDDAGRAADTFVACWAGAYLGFFSLAGTKLPSYVLPCYPALAVVCGVLIDEWVRRPAVVSRGWFRAALVTPAVVGTVLVVALPIVAGYLLPGEQWLGALGVSLIVGAAALAWAMQRRPAAVPAVFAVMAVVFVTSLVAGAAGRVSRHTVSPAVMADARAALGDDARVIGFRHFEPTLAFYARREVRVAFAPEDLRRLLAETPNACIVTRDDQLDELAAALGDAPEILARYRRFLRTSGEVVVALPPEVSYAARRDPSLAR